MAWSIQANLFRELPISDSSLHIRWSLVNDEKVQFQQLNPFGSLVYVLLDNSMAKDW
jgi:hypothetical protein